MGWLRVAGPGRPAGARAEAEADGAAVDGTGTD
jgi:hypothetical protein